VLTKSSIGQPALARWRREFDEAEQRKEQHLAQFYQAKKYNQRWENPRVTARRNAINAIMPTLEKAAKIVADKYGFGIVMAKGNPEMVMTTFYSVDAVDLTDRVIEELNQRFP
jgi:Skp family chaperone for outer membrane proteins